MRLGSWPRSVRNLFPDKESLAGKASRAIGWSFVSTFLGRLGTLVTSVWLARLLGPHAFGVYAVALVALFAMQMFNDLGVSMAIVRWQEDPAEIVPTVTTISVLVSIVTFVAFYFASPAYAAATGVPTATPVIRVLAICILIDGFVGAPDGLLQRYFRQGKRTIAIQSAWLGTGVTITLAATGHGAMSLAIGQVVGALATAALLVAFAPESLRFGFNPHKARMLLRFSLPLAGSNLIAFAVTSVDQLVIGHMLGGVELGYYVLAFNLATWPLTMCTRPVRSVAPAIFARLQHDREAMRTTFLSILGVLLAVALPVCLLIGGSATPLIGFVYGPDWMPAARPLLWLVLIAAMKILFELAYDYLVILARTRFLLLVQAVWLLALIPALIVGAREGGIYGAALAEAAVAGFVVLPLYVGGLRNAGIRLRAFASHVWLQVVGAVDVGVISVGLAKIVPSEFLALAASGVVTVAIIGLLAIRMRSALSLLRASQPQQNESTIVFARPFESTIVFARPVESTIVFARPVESTIVFARPVESTIVFARPDESIGSAWALTTPADDITEVLPTIRASLLDAMPPAVPPVESQPQADGTPPDPDLRTPDIGIKIM